jgi:hypothetical protein
MLDFANKKSLVKYKVLIKKVPIPIARTKVKVWFCGLKRFNKLWRAVKPQEVGKYFFMAFMANADQPAIMANVTIIPATKDKEYFQSLNNQYENKNKKVKIATATAIRPRLDLDLPTSCTLKA